MPEGGLQILLHRQVQESVDDGLVLLPGDLGDGLALEPPVLLQQAPRPSSTRAKRRVLLVGRAL